MNDGNLTDNGINVSPDTQGVNRNFLEQQCASGANWFYWIAALSLINSVIFISGGKSQFYCRPRHYTDNRRNFPTVWKYCKVYRPGF